MRKCILFFGDLFYSEVVRAWRACLAPLCPLRRKACLLLISVRAASANLRCEPFTTCWSPQWKGFVLVYPWIFFVFFNPSGSWTFTHSSSCPVSPQGLMHSSGPVGRHRQLVLVLEGELYLIPFALLKGSSSNEYLYERFSLISVPSLGSLRETVKVRRLHFSEEIVVVVVLTCVLCPGPRWGITGHSKNLVALQKSAYFMCHMFIGGTKLECC